MRIEIKFLDGNILFMYDVLDNTIGRTVKAAIECGLDLSEADLSCANLSGANLSGTDLSWADLREANLSGANLSGANLRRANLDGANLRDADLHGANLFRADLVNANLDGANLNGANVRDASLSWEHLRQAALSGANIEGLNIPSAEESAPLLTSVAKAALESTDALNMNTWHTCETTHCIAGWAVVLSGDRGKNLEAAYGTDSAGLLLLGAEAAAHFYDSTPKARAWLQNVLEGVK